ncbi:hypothetical protein PINS_up001638 [Pythium insidiosum]|nr:hypothetical protein PINS_up001638 [Pythium insidiosum]
MKSFTTDDLPSDKRPLLPPKKGFSERILEGRLSLQNQLHHINSESVAKLSAVIVEKVKRSFSIDESERVLREDWTILETEDQQLEDLKQVIDNLDSAFQFSKSSALVNLATSTLRRCESLVERSVVHTEQCQLLFSQCSNEITTLHDYLAKLRDALEPSVAPRDRNEEKRITRRAEWAISRMTQSSQEMVSEMRENLDELDDMITECTRLMVETITLLHMRFRSADFSGTGVAAGAATVVAGAMVSAAGLIAAPVTGGLSVPISVAGKGLFFTGLAALTPSTIMLNRHSQQLDGLTKLAEHLKTRLEIMNQKRDEMSSAFAVCEELEVHIKQASSFCQDAVELEVSSHECVWPFIEPVYAKLATLNGAVTLFLTTPSIWHYCKAEDALHQYLLPDADED